MTTTALPDFVVPMDPQEAETRIPPVDLDVCSTCRGSGAMWDGRDPQSGDVCPVCGGDGVMHPLWGGDAA